VVVTKYEGPYCNLELANGTTDAVQGTREQITAQLRNPQDGFVELEDVYGNVVTVNPEHIIQVRDTLNHP
jgi:hypothetical protein